jgi:hypothetical protein
MQEPCNFIPHKFLIKILLWFSLPPVAFLSHEMMNILCLLFNRDAMVSSSTRVRTVSLLGGYLSKRPSMMSILNG